MAEHPSYNHTDIQRYLQQQMSPQEMHAFEKAMLDDPFLADAMEGYQQTDENTSVKNLSSIEKELRGKKERAKVIAMPSRSKSWMRVAAAAIVIAAAVIVTYQVTNKHQDINTSQVAEAKKQPAATPADTTAPVTFGNDIAADNHDLKEKLGKTSAAASAPAIAKTPGKEEEPKTIAANNAPLTMHAPASERQAAASMQSRSETEMKAAKDRALYEEKSAAADVSVAAPKAANEFAGKVVDENGEAMPFAAVRSANGNSGTVADANGKFMLRSADSVLQVNVNAAGYATANAKLKSNKPEEIVLKEQTGTLSELVISGYAKKRAAKETTASANQIPSITSMPVNGWNNFNAYLHARIDSLKASGNYSFETNEAEVRFRVNEQGRPINIKVVSALNATAADKLAEIIRQGPNWTVAKKRTKVKLNISL